MSIAAVPEEIVDAELVDDYTREQFDADLTAVETAMRELAGIVQTAEERAGSLGTAERLHRAFTRGRQYWGPIMMPKRPKRQTDPYSRSRFASYLLKFRPAGMALRPAHVYRLLTAVEMEPLFSPVGENKRPRNEWVMRPLATLLQLDQAQAVPEVWERAVEAADGHPTAEQVRHEVAEWKREHGYTGAGTGVPRKRIAGRESFTEKVSRMVAAARNDLEALIDVDVDAAERLLEAELAKVRAIQARQLEADRAILAATATR